MFLTREWRSSKTHHVCGNILSAEVNRVKYCKHNNGEAACAIGINRDINAPANIGQYGLAQLTGAPLPEHLADPRLTSTIRVRPEARVKSSYLPLRYDYNDDNNS